MQNIHFRTFELAVFLSLALGCGGSSLSTSPAAPDASLTVVPPLGQVVVQPRRGGVVLTLPPVAGAVDYRAFACSDVTPVVPTGAGEQINGGVLYCAGNQQHNAPLAPLAVVPKIQLDDVTRPTVFLVEAIDRPCPFPGAFGRTHADIAYPTSDHPELRGSF